MTNPYFDGTGTDPDFTKADGLPTPDEYRDLEPRRWRLRPEPTPVPATEPAGFADDEEF